jgi:FlaA1/EpsC-like NDP-sugar epimerase
MPTRQTSGLNSRVQAFVLSLPRPIKRLLAFGLDATLCVLAVWCSLALRLETLSPFTFSGPIPVAVSVALALPIFIAFGLYKAIFRYSGREALVHLARAVGVYGVLYFLVFSLIGVAGVPRSLGLTQPTLLFFLIGASRWLLGGWIGASITGGDRAIWPGVLIYGAGSAGQQLAHAVNAATQRRFIGFLDDDPALWNNTINGWRVYPREKLDFLIKSKGAKELWLAMPSISGPQRKALVEFLRLHQIRVQTLPNLSDLASGRVRVKDIRELDIDELLGREQVTPDLRLFDADIKGKTVLVTGAGGSIGSELCRQILAVGPDKLILLDNSEYSLYKINQELGKLVLAKAGQLTDTDTDLVFPILGSVTDDVLIRRVYKTCRPDTVFHAAAYKHVPLLESNPVQGIKNNVWGTLVCARHSLEFGVSKFVLVSTDKAVRPTNIMGASKRLAELVVQAFAADSKSSRTIFTMVRFGNVIGSSGSVIPLFRRQIAGGGPVTVTHPEVTRYFMSIREAAQLVIQAGAMAKGGEVFLLDMGKPVKISELAREIVELSGFTVRDEQNPRGDIEVKFSGLRAGEKLYEELLIGNNSKDTLHPKIKRADEPFVLLGELLHELQSLETALDDHNVTAIHSRLKTLVAGYSNATNF